MATIEKSIKCKCARRTAIISGPNFEEFHALWEEWRRCAS